MPVPYPSCTHRPPCDEVMLSEGRACSDCNAEHDEEMGVTALRAESRADDQALWEEQLGLLIEYRRTNMSPEKLVRIWLYNRKHADAIRSWRRCPIIPSTA